MKECKKKAIMKYAKENIKKYPFSSRIEKFSFVYQINKRYDQDIISFLESVKENQSLNSFFIDLLKKDAKAKGFEDLKEFMNTIKADPNDSINKHISSLIRDLMKENPWRIINDKSYELFLLTSDIIEYYILIVNYML